MWYFFAAAAMVPDICLWVLRCAMKKFRPCSVIRCGHIHSMLPCFFLAKPEFFSLPLAKASSTMPVIFLRTFHDRCRRFGSHSFERFFFCLETYVYGFYRLLRITTDKYSCNRERFFRLRIKLRRDKRLLPFRLYIKSYGGTSGCYHSAFT